MKLAQSDDINVFKNSVLTTQSNTNIIVLKPKTMKIKNIFNEKRMYFVL